MIIISNLCKRFGPKEVLRGINLKIYDGESLVILGPSGCGKSVLLKHIIGLLKPDEGQVLIDGEDITKFDQKRLDALRMRMGMLFQSAALFDSLTVEENIAFGLRKHTNLSDLAIHHIVSEKLEMVGLPGANHLMPSELSGGMRKRVGLARAIAMEPEIILYDEPTTGLDPIMTCAIDELHLSLKERLGVTSIVVTHDLNSAYRIGDRLALHYGGRIVAIGTKDEIINSPDPLVQQFIRGEAKGPMTLL
ncbi:MAG: Methionine ABC transporter ATP-binding protein [Candidatus Ozemobacter sibiricus]|jgi:phospholipid/cholesterol/gamma-HCH transport system ATP-binding protein|uniref:Methionine ABC transporter ATP-binding protein n=1 Tax=Candidatus Ozemobacter sibiricus TaxID=2268124 RepID=A0A367ZR88_9BACT|nr:MAG: Methionine ABC transporter ATP-binding protein [Candidatus Ozemobacter sibiricus]